MKILTLQGTFPSCNEYIAANNRNRFISATMKRDETERTYWACREQKCPKFEIYPVTVYFTWYMPNKRKDPDNFIFAKKFILDGIVKAGVLKDDGWDEIAEIGDRWELDRENPRVEVDVQGWHKADFFVTTRDDLEKGF